jgi:hypothetical protein
MALLEARRLPEMRLQNVVERMAPRTHLTREAIILHPTLREAVPTLMLSIIPSLCYMN